MSDHFQSKTRFSNRVDDYTKARPGYPADILKTLAPFIAVSAPVVADIGSGTGKLSEVFLKDHITYCVEPNKEMREAAETTFKDEENFFSINGSAEETGLQSNTIDLIVAGQAFHWFNPETTYQEFSRILKNNGVVALIWNERNPEDKHMQAYEKALQNHCPDYAGSLRKIIDEQAISAFFKVEKPIKKSLYHSQPLSLSLLKSRALSSSYVPKSGPDYEKLMEELEFIFNEYQSDNIISFEYETQIFIHQFHK